MAVEEIMFLANNFLCHNYWLPLGVKLIRFLFAFGAEYGCTHSLLPSLRCMTFPG